MEDGVATPYSVGWLGGWVPGGVVLRGAPSFADDLQWYWKYVLMRQASSCDGLKWCDNDDED